MSWEKSKMLETGGIAGLEFKTWSSEAQLFS